MIPEAVSPIRRIADFEPSNFASSLASEGLAVEIGPFKLHLRASIAEVHESLLCLYGDYPHVADPAVFTLHACIRESRSLFGKRRVRFEVDGFRPHGDMPIQQSLAVLEWGINLVLALRSHCFLILHAAAVERNGSGLLLPAAPGFGKSTLCAALAHGGWRLLSDEFGLVRPGSPLLIPVPRPMALKNESIDIIRSIAPDAVFGPRIPGTRKGTVAHVKPPVDSVLRQETSAAVRWIVFPRWQEGAPTKLDRISKGDCFMRLATNAFNYEMLGERGFCAIRDLQREAEFFQLSYSDLESAIARVDALADG